MSDRQNTSIQQSILTMLAFSDPQGQRLAGLVAAKDFDDIYQPVALRLLEYRHEYKKGPGDAHLDDCLGNLISGDSRLSGSYRQIISDMMRQHELTLNEEFVLAETTKWKNKQNRKKAILDAAGELQSQGDNVDLDSVDAILKRAMKNEIEGDDSILFNTPDALSFLDSYREQRGYSTGLPLLDKCGISINKGEMLLLVAAKGTGKSWWLTHCGVEGVRQRAKVLHISLEMNADRVCQRYMQSFFQIARTDKQVLATEILWDKNDKMYHDSYNLRPTLFFDDKNIRTKLLAKWKGKYQLGRLMIKSFPTRSLTVPLFEAYLEFIEVKYSFVPDIVLFDYPDLMKINPRYRREETGIVFEELRGLSEQRQFAIVTVTQSSREGAKSEQIKGTHVSEDWSKMMTADIVLTLSRTTREERINLARLYIEKNRNDRGGLTFLISQLYDLGQFIYDGAMATIEAYDEYKKMLEEDDDDDSQRDTRHSAKARG